MFEGEWDMLFYSTFFHLRYLACFRGVSKQIATYPLPFQD